MALFDKYPDCGEPLKPHKILPVLEGQIVEVYILRNINFIVILN